MNDMNVPNVPPENAVKNITISSVLGWLLGVVLLVVGILFLVTNFTSGVLVVIAALLLLPPTSDYLVRKKNIKLSGGVRFVLAVILFVVGMNMYSKSALENAVQKHSEASPAVQQKVNNPPRAEAEQLELLSMNCSREYGFFKVSGQVKNISEVSMKNVMVVGTIYADDGSFITSTDALIAYNPVLAGQTSPYEAMTTDNPLAARCDVAFKELMGGTISLKRSDKDK